MGKTILDEMTYDELVKHTEETIAHLVNTTYNEGYKQGEFDAEMEINEEKADREFYESHVTAYKEMEQERRDEIVEQAKAYVSNTLEVPAKEFYYSFEINRKKRTVVALERRIANGMVWGRGIAKCAPNDCFNVHIGKAIALRRALGLEVPDEYLNAPQPTEVRVGDVVRGVNRQPHYYNTGRTFTLSKNFGTSGDLFRYREDSEDWICKEDIGKIIDDSREEGDE